MTETFQKIKASASKLEVFPYVEVTPEVAQDLLTINQENRPLKRRLVQKYAKVMKDGKWRYVGDVVRISKNGFLLDAQHRLHAIIESGVPQYFNFQTGLEERAFDVIDTGRSRTAFDTLSIVGHQNANAMATALRVIMMYDDGVMSNYQDPNKSLSTHERYSTQELLEWLDKNGSEEIGECVTMATRLNSKHRFISSSDIAAFLYLFGRVDVELSRTFFEMLMSGVNISTEKHAALYFLRERLLQWQIQPRSAGTRRERYALMIKAWNAYIAGREIKRLSWRPSDGFPTIATIG